MKKSSIKESVTAELKRRIVFGTYPPDSMMPTQRQLAREFGTSPTTIYEAMQEIEGMEWVVQKPRLGIHLLPIKKRPRTWRIAIIAPNKPPYRTEIELILRSIKQHVERLHQAYEIFIAKELPHNFGKELRSEYDGVLVMEAGDQETEDLVFDLETAHYPYVVANQEKDRKLTCTWVCHRRIIRSAVNLLSGLGHRRIAFIRRTLKEFFYQNAFAGYRQGLADAYLPYDEGLVLATHGMIAAEAAIETCDFIKQILRDPFAPTAVIACRDYLARGACRAVEEAGLAIGQDVSVIGYDDLSWPEAKGFLTTFREPCANMATTAVEMLIERIISGRRPVVKREIDAPLILRKSVGPCPDNLEPTYECRVFVSQCDKRNPYFSDGGHVSCED